MARKAQRSEPNKSEHVRDLLRQNPNITATEAIAALGKMSIDISPNLFYFVKGKMKGRKGRRKQIRRNVATVMANGEAPTSAAKADVLATIRKVKAVAMDVGGLKKLAALLEALAE